MFSQAELLDKRGMEAHGRWHGLEAPGRGSGPVGKKSSHCCWLSAVGFLEVREQRETRLRGDEAVTDSVM